jgi:hypothetical protein
MMKLFAYGLFAVAGATLLSIGYAETLVYVADTLRGICS